MATAQDAAAKLSRARAGLVLDAPFFGAIALRLKPEADTTAKTCWTDGETLGYDPEFVDSLSLDELKGVLAHEVLHVAAAHHARRGERDPRRWNQATDAAINGLLAESGFRLPAGGVPGDPDKRAAEEVYATMPEPEKGDGGDGAGEPGGEPDNDPGGTGEVRDAPGKDGRAATQAELAQAEAETRVMVSQAAAAAKACGNLPAGIARLVEQVMEPRLPWREILRRFVDEASPSDYSWSRPNRRYLAGGLYLPALYQPELRPLVVAVDTSGSVRQADLDRFGAEIAAIAQDTRTHVSVLYCDAEIAGTAEFAPDEPVKLDAKGGGGTDFRPPFAEVERRGDTPSCLIYLTDGDCSRFPEAPEYGVLWAVTGDARRFKPPFGEVLEIRD